MDDSAKLFPKSDQSATEEVNETPTTENTHDRLHMNSSNTINRNDQPETPHNLGSPQTGIEKDPRTPQQNLVQSTTTQSHGSDQHTPMPISEHRTVHTHGQGSNPTRPLKDESTQIPSQEVLMITSNQGTQFPSQQWEQTPKSKDQEDTQNETHMPERPVSQTSCQRTRVPGTHSSFPIQTSPAKTHTANTVDLHILADSRLAGTRESTTPETNQTMESNNARIVDLEHVTNDDYESDGIIDFNIPNEDHTNNQHITARTKPGLTDTKGNGKPVTSHTTTPDDLGTHTIAETQGDQPLDTSQTIEKRTTNEHHLTTQTNRESTGKRDIKNPTPVQNKTTESHEPGGRIHKTASGMDTLYQHPRTVQDNAETKEQENSTGTTTPVSKVMIKTNSGITIRGTDAPIIINISESSSDDNTQGPTIPPSEKTPDRDFQEITISSSEANSGGSNSPSQTEITISSSGDEADDESQDIITISSEGSLDGDRETRSQTPQRYSQDQEVTILENNSPRDETEKNHQTGRNTNNAPDHNNNVSIQPRRETPQHKGQGKPPTTRNSCDGTLYRLTPIGNSDHPGHQIGPCYTHPNISGNTPSNWSDNDQWSLIQTTDPQGINNFNQNPNGRLTTTNLGYPECNYCKLPSHSRQKCAFRLKDLENDIDRHQHPRKGFLTKYDARQYKPPIKRNRSLMSIRLAKETDNTGSPKFWQTQSGHIIYSINNQPQCYYCGIPFHGRDTCPRRREDESRGIFQIYHPLRGMLYTSSELVDPDQTEQKPKEKTETSPHIKHDEPSTSSFPRNRESTPTSYKEKREPKDYKTKPKGNRTTRKRKYTDRTETSVPNREEIEEVQIVTNDERNQDTTQDNSTTSTNLMDIPNEIIQNITKYLPFEDNMRLRRVNKRLWHMAGNTSIWKEITILSRPLTCSLINHAINKQTKVLNVRYCAIQGNHTKMLHLGRKLRDGFSKLTFLGLQGFKGNDILAAIIAAESEDLETLDLSENRYSLVGTVIGRLKENNRIKAINLSAIGGHYAEMGGLVYHPFDIHRMKPLVDKCRHLTDIILFGAKLTHEAITYFCENAPSTLLRINLARERAYNDDIKALTRSCPHLQYLNIAETSVAYQDIINIVLLWKRTMINLCLPHRLGFVLTLRSRAPNLPLIRQFQALMNEMQRLEYLHVGHYKFHQVDVDQRNPQVERLRSMFPHLKINHNPYSTCPHTGGNNIPQSDPSFRFKRNIGPNSWASRRDAETVPIVDLI